MKNDSSSPARGGRPAVPQTYGLKPVVDEDDLVSLQHVDERMRAARNYWIGSTRPDGRPHAMPVWGVWLDGAFYFSTDPLSRKGRNLAANPEVVVHLESGDDVVILEGAVEVEKDPALLKQADEAYFTKYAYRLVEDIQNPGLVYRLRPRTVYAWPESSFTQKATRWMLRE
jgi:general stress protein 26